MLDQETKDFIVSAVAEAIRPLRATMSLRAEHAAEAFPTPQTSAGGTKRPSAAMSILASKGIQIPFTANGSVSFYKLQAAMTEAGLDASRQTTVKVDLIESGCKFDY